MAPRDHPGGPWEQQHGHEVANDRIVIDFGMISGLVYVSFWNSKCFKNRFMFELVSTFSRRLRIQIIVFALKALQKSTFHGNIV